MFGIITPIPLVTATVARSHPSQRQNASVGAQELHGDSGNISIHI